MPLMPFALALLSLVTATWFFIQEYSKRLDYKMMVNLEYHLKRRTDILLDLKANIEASEGEAWKRCHPDRPREVTWWEATLFQIDAALQDKGPHE